MTAPSVSQAHREAQLTASRVRIDTGGHGTLALYDSPRPSGGAAPGASPLVTIVLATPCGTVGSGVLSLVQNDPAGDLITASGVALWGRIFNGAGAAEIDGDVSDEAGTGLFRLAGTSGTQIYAGGYAILAGATLG